MTAGGGAEADRRRRPSGSAGRATTRAEEAEPLLYRSVGRQAQAPRSGPRPARARTRGASSRRRCHLTQPAFRTRPRLPHEDPLGRPARSHLRRAAAALSHRAAREAWSGEMRILTFLTDSPVVSAILLHLDLPHKSPRVSPARAPGAPVRSVGRSDLLTGLLDQTPAFDPAEPDPVHDQRSASVPSSSTSPRPTTSTSEAPESGRPAGDSPSSPFPAHPRISAAHSGSLSSRGSPAVSCRPHRPLSPPLRRPPRHSLPRPTSPPAAKGP